MKNQNNLLWLLIGIFWTIVIGSFAWQESRDGIIEHALLQARASYDKDLVYRRWAANHGDIYVPVSAQTPPNPYLKNTPERDIETPSGRQFTLINPAHMIRQVNELVDGSHGVKGHITSLKPLRPENKPQITLRLFRQKNPRATGSATRGNYVGERPRLDTLII